MNSLTYKPNVLHLLHKSFPEYVGYTIRSQFILSHQKKFANPYALTRPFFIRKNNFDSFDKVIYFRYPRNFFEEFIHYLCFYKYFNLEKYFNRIYYDILKIPKKFIIKLVNHYKIDIIHGHTSFLFSNLGQIVANKKTLPFIYEIRGFWEDTMVALELIKENEKTYNLLQQKQTNLMKKSDAIVTLGKMMKRELINRGVDEKKIYIVPNAVDIESFQPNPPDSELKKNLNINNNYIIGYIGSIREIEGIEILINAISIVRREIKSIKLLLVGGYNKSYYFRLEKLIEELKLKDTIIFTGQIALTEINRYYSIVDIIVIPRINTRINRIVTPLKQLEAMAMKKVVIASDLPALRETIKPEVSGDLFEPENFEDLARKIIYYLNNRILREKLGQSARNFVKQNYDWKLIIDKYHIIYEKLLKKPIIY